MTISCCFWYPPFILWRTLKDAGAEVSIEVFTAFSRFFVSRTYTGVYGACMQAAIEMSQGNQKLWQEGEVVGKDGLHMCINIHTYINMWFAYGKKQVKAN